MIKWKRLLLRHRTNRSRYFLQHIQMRDIDSLCAHPGTKKESCFSQPSLGSVCVWISIFLWRSRASVRPVRPALGGKGCPGRFSSEHPPDRRRSFRRLPASFRSLSVHWSSFSYFSCLVGVFLYFSSFRVFSTSFSASGELECVSKSISI